MWNKQVATAPRNSVKQIVKYLIENPFQTETEIQENVFDYFRYGYRQIEPNKKYADLLRRGLQKGLYKRFLWKKKSWMKKKKEENEK